ncbi:MAG TPA: AAA family ATPase [bacterium]|nr:AAA family ATPase [bacterium]
MIISIGGTHGSGKSTIAKMLAKKLNWPHYYMGGLRRETAKKKGLTLAEYNKLGENDPTTDLEVDNYQKQLGQTQDNFIIEGRTSWHFIPQSFKIYLDVNENIGAERVFSHLKNDKNNNRNEDVNLNSIEAVKESMAKRLESDKKRYKKYFGIDVYDKNNYDYYLDTSCFDIQEVFDQVLKAVYKQLNNIDKK